MDAHTPLRADTWERVERSVELVRARLLRATNALTAAGVEHAIAGGNAVAAWVAQVDEEAVRATKDVDVIVRRSDFEKVKTALEGAGFVYRHAAALDMFLDGPDGSPRSAVHLLFGNERVRPGDMLPIPDPIESTTIRGQPILKLDALVKNKLNAFRDKDRTHLRDFIDLGLVDATWLSRLHPEIGDRLRELLDNPE